MPNNLINVTIEDTRDYDLSFTRHVYFVHNVGTNKFLTGDGDLRLVTGFSKARPFASATQARRAATALNMTRRKAVDFEIYETNIKIAA